MRWLDGLTDQWTWVCSSSRIWWWTGQPGVLQFLGSEIVGQDCATELKWTEYSIVYMYQDFFIHSSADGPLGYFHILTTVHNVSMNIWLHISISISSVPHSCPTLCDPINYCTPGLPVHHQLQEFTQTHVHWVGDAIQPSHPLSFPSSPAPNPSQHQGLFQWVNSSHEVAKVLEFQLQHQSFQWTPRTDLL